MGARDLRDAVRRDVDLRNHAAEQNSAEARRATHSPEATPMRSRITMERDLGRSVATAGMDRRTASLPAAPRVSAAMAVVAFMEVAATEEAEDAANIG